MKDPVLLPSGISVDRTTIQRHLLSDNSDPFTRAPLTEDMLIPNTGNEMRYKQKKEKLTSSSCSKELKEKIEQYFKHQKQ